MWGGILYINGTVGYLLFFVTLYIWYKISENRKKDVAIKRQEYLHNNAMRHIGISRDTGRCYLEIIHESLVENDQRPLKVNGKAMFDQIQQEKRSIFEEAYFTQAAGIKLGLPPCGKCEGCRRFNNPYLHEGDSLL
jgi:hypothetical protein